MLGEIEHIINDSLNKFYDKFINVIDPDDFPGDDLQKIQSAINQVNENTKSKETTILQLNRIFDITNNSIKVNKPVNREKLIITGLNGGIVKNDDGYIFEKTDTSYVTDIEIKDTTIRGTTGTKLFKSPDFINVSINNCKLENFDTLVDSETYMQNIHLTNSLITGGNGDLFIGCGFYGLFITGCTIEHRKGYVVKQTVKDGNMYDSCYFVDMTHNLIEGFIEGGIAYLKKISKVNICNNYFENMINAITLDTIVNNGVLSVDNNRYFIGTSQVANYGKKGLINILTNTYPDIHAHCNIVENCYLLNISNGFSVTKKINLNCNDVTNSNTTDEYTENGNNKNHEINIFPLVPTSEGVNKYQRTIVVISDKRYSKKLTVNEDDVRLSVLNGEIHSSVSTNKLIGASTTNLNIYFGVPVYSDDLTDIQVFSQSIDVTSKYRFGSGDEKYLLVVCNSTNGSSQTPIINTTLRGGAGIRG